MAEPVDEAEVADRRIDLEEMNAAATKIQSVHRGRQARKEVEVIRKKKRDTQEQEARAKSDAAKAAAEDKVGHQQVFWRIYYSAPRDLGFVGDKDTFEP